MSMHHIGASRRHFLQFMAASPLLAAASRSERAGVERVLGLLRFETRIAMQQLGAPSLKDITPDMVRRV